MTTLANMLAAAQRLLNYYNGDEKTAQNPGGLTGVGGMADNWDPCIQDIGTVANGVGDALSAVSASEGNAAASATAAAGSATAANASKVAAATSAGNAAGSAIAAAGSASAAAGSATAANASKLAAAISEGNAAGSATTAAQQAGTATARAGEAAGSAAAAAGSASTATTKAGEAAASASAAAASAGTAATSASAAAASAAAAQTLDPASYLPKSGVAVTATANAVAQRDAGGALFAAGYRTGNGWVEVSSTAGGQGWLASNLYHDGTYWRTRSTHGGIGARALMLNWPSLGDVSIAEVTGATTADAVVVPTVRTVWHSGNLPLTVSGTTMNFPSALTVTVIPLANVANTFTPNCNAGVEFDCGTIAAASVIANPINPPASGKVQPISIKWTQDATGGRAMSFGGNCINVGGTSANTGAGKINFAVGKIYSDGKFYYSIVRGA